MIRLPIFFFFFNMCRILQLSPETRRGGGLGLDFREQATSSEKVNNPPGVGGIDGKDVSE